MWVNGARIDRGAVLFPGVFIGPDAVIGEDSVLHPGVTVYRRVSSAGGVTLHAGSSRGGDGLGLPGQDGKTGRFPGGHRTDRRRCRNRRQHDHRPGTLGRTDPAGAKIDNLVQIAHNVVVGENSIIVSQAGIAGSTTLGKGVILGGRPASSATSGSGIMSWLPLRARASTRTSRRPDYFRRPHRPHREWLRQEACLSKLPELRQALKALQRQGRRSVRQPKITVKEHIKIHPTAIISPDARLAESVEVGPYSIIGPDVQIGAGTVIGPHVVIEKYTDIGEGAISISLPPSAPIPVT